VELGGSATVNGTFTASGGWGARYYYSGGSGGGIFLTSQGPFVGGTGAVFNVAGGNATWYGAYSGGGGGGRIAVWFGMPDSVKQRILTAPDNPSVQRSLIVMTNVYSGFLGTNTVDGGIGYSNGTPGTVRFLTVDLQKGTLFFLQ